jgi:hypothetical protein
MNKVEQEQRITEVINSINNFKEEFTKHQDNLYIAIEKINELNYDIFPMVGDVTYDYDELIKNVVTAYLNNTSFDEVIKVVEWFDYDFQPSTDKEYYNLQYISGFDDILDLRVSADITYVIDETLNKLKELL